MANVGRVNLKSKLRESNANYFDNMADSVATLSVDLTHFQQECLLIT